MSSRKSPDVCRTMNFKVAKSKRFEKVGRSKVTQPKFHDFLPLLQTRTKTIFLQEMASAFDIRSAAKSQLFV